MDFYGNQQEPGYDEDGVYVAQAVGQTMQGGGDGFGDGDKPQNTNSRINYQREQMKKKHRDQDGGGMGAFDMQNNLEDIGQIQSANPSELHSMNPMGAIGKKKKKKKKKVNN